jgi:hypothetical protein
MPARLTGITGLTGLRADCSSALDHGMAGTVAGVMAAAVGATDAPVMDTAVADTDTARAVMPGEVGMLDAATRAAAPVEVAGSTARRAAATAVVVDFTVAAVVPTAVVAVVPTAVAVGTGNRPGNDGE